MTHGRHRGSHLQGLLCFVSDTFCAWRHACYLSNRPGWALDLSSVSALRVIREVLFFCFYLWIQVLKCSKCDPLCSLLEFKLLIVAGIQFVDALKPPLIFIFIGPVVPSICQWLDSEKSLPNNCSYLEQWVNFQADSDCKCNKSKCLICYSDYIYCSKF